MYKSSHNISFFSDLHTPENLLLIGISKRKTKIIDRYCGCFVSALLFWERAKLLQVKKIFVKDNFSFRTNQEISKLSARKSCRKYYWCTADTGSWLKTVMITTKTFAVYISLSWNIEIITAILTRLIPKICLQQ